MRMSEQCEVSSPQASHHLACGQSNEGEANPFHLKPDLEIVQLTADQKGLRLDKALTRHELLLVLAWINVPDKSL